MEPTTESFSLFTISLQTHIKTQEDLVQAVAQGMSRIHFEQELSTFKEQLKNRPSEWNDLLNRLVICNGVAVKNNILHAIDVQAYVLEQKPKLYLATLREILTKCENSPVRAIKLIEDFFPSSLDQDYKEQILRYIFLELFLRWPVANEQVRNEVFNEFSPSIAKVTVENIKEAMKEDIEEGKKEDFARFLVIFKSIFFPNKESIGDQLANIHQIHKCLVQKKRDSQATEINLLELFPEHSKDLFYLNQATLLYSVDVGFSLQAVFQLMEGLECPMTPILLQKIISYADLDSDLNLILEKIRTTTEGEKTVSLQKTFFLFMTLLPSDKTWVKNFLDHVDGKTFTIDEEIWNLFTSYWGEGPYEGWSHTLLADGRYQLSLT